MFRACAVVISALIRRRWRALERRRVSRDVASDVSRTASRAARTASSAARATIAVDVFLSIVCIARARHRAADVGAARECVARAETRQSASERDACD